MHRTHLLTLALLLCACGGPDPTPSPTAVPDSDGDTVPDALDCDPYDATIYEGAPEDGGTETQLSDGKDNDCDDATDEGMLDIDDDGDGFSDDGSVGGVADCDDEDADRFPGHEEVPYDGVDQDCSGADLTDVDEDGADAEEVGGGDCDDLDPTIYPEAPEDGGAGNQLSDGKDNDCDDAVDEGLLDVDDDGDGFTDLEGDCDDDNDTVFPGAEEIPYDGIDQDCALGDLTDVDGDGFDASAVGGPDCDDNDDTIYAGATELCDGKDNDCDTVIPEDEAEGTFYPDADLDGFGDGDDGATSLICAPPEGYVTTPGDCDDGDGAVNPDAVEACDNKDTDCDPETDELDPITFYPDVDGDGFGADTGVFEGNLCTDPEGLIATGGDCDDAAPQTYPGAPELCDGEDNDCDPETQDGDDLDFDGDGVAVCDAEGQTLDCDDRDPNTAPGKPDWQDDRRDNDCDGVVDGPTQASTLLPYLYGVEVNVALGEVMDGGRDADGDGLDDLLVGGYRSDVAGTDSGTVYLVYGDEDGVETGPIDAASVQIQGYDGSDNFGFHVSFAGDLNGDGWEDIVVSAPRENQIARNLGAAYIFFGDGLPMDPVTSGQAADVKLVNEAEERYFGTRMAGVGDLNGDGMDDLAVATGGGRALIYYGRESWPDTLFDGSDPEHEGPDLTFTGLKAGDYDEEIAFAGTDMNGDGYGELLVGAAKDGSNRGGFYILDGRADASALDGLPMSEVADAAYLGLGTTDNLGESVAAGDLNGDGLGDAVIGAPGARANTLAGPSASGRVFVLFGREEGLGALTDLTMADVRLGGVETNGRAGTVVRVVPDVTGDDTQDLTVYALAGNAGALYLITGRDEAWQEGTRDRELTDIATLTLVGQTGDYLGEGAAPLGNLLGRPSGLAVSAKLSDTPDVDLGQIFLMEGRDTAPTPFPETPTPEEASPTPSPSPTEAVTPTPGGPTPTPEAPTPTPAGTPSPTPVPGG